MKKLKKDKVFVGFYSDLVLKGKFGNRQKLYDIDLVKLDLLNHFYTRRGERVMLPDFGTIIWDMLFEPYTDINLSIIKDDIEKVIKTEPRVELISSNLETYEYGIIVRVELLYKYFNTSEVLTLDFDQRAAERI